MTTLKIVATREININHGVSYGVRFAAVALRVVLWPVRVARTRKVMNQLAGMSDYELRDIGLIRDDIVSAQAVPLDRDPTLLLEQRARERAEARLRRRNLQNKPYY